MKTIVYFALGGLAVAGTAYVLIKQNKKPILSTLDESNKISSPTSASSLTKPSTPSGTVGVNPKIEEPLKVFQTGSTSSTPTTAIKLQEVATAGGLEAVAKVLDEQNRDRQAQIILDKLVLAGKTQTEYTKLKQTIEKQLLDIGYKLVGGDVVKYFVVHNKTPFYKLTPASAVRI